MEFRQWRHRAAMSFGHRASWIRRLGAFALICLAMMWTMPAHAAAPLCANFSVPDSNTTPSTSPMASGGTISINVTACDSLPGVVGVGPVTSGPLNGSATISNGSTDTITYVNNGNGQTTDSFTFNDSNGTAISVTVAIGASTSPITVSPGTYPALNVGTFNSTSLSATGGTAPYTFTLSSGSLPPGLTISGNVISGTPTTAGSSAFTIHVVDKTGLSVDKSYSVTVPVPTITLSALPNPVQGAPYSQPLSSSGGTAPYTYSVDVGPLPPGLSLNSGVVSGTPTTQGSYSFTIRSTDHSAGGPYFNSRTYNVTVLAPPPLTFSPTSLGNGQVGSSYSGGVAASGGTAPYTYSVSAGSLPAGMSLNTSTGALSGTPTAGGTFNFTIAAHDAGASTGTQAYTLIVSAPTITLTPATLPSATQASAYSQSLTASGGTAAYTYAVTSGSLPAGMTLSSAGTLSGTPTVSGAFTFQITATDSSTGTGPYTGSRNYTLTVNALPPVITTTSLTAGSVGTSYSQTIAVSGGNSPLSFAVTAGSLPAGLSLSSSGVLSGTPTAGGSFSFSITVTDALSATSTQSYSLTIAAPTIAVAPGTLPAATLHGAYNQTVTGAGGTAPYTFSVTAGALPTGMALSSSGVLSGNPTANGNYSFTITATDGSTGTGPFTGSQSYSVTVSAPSITLSPGSSLPAGSVSTSYSQVITASGGSGPYTYAVTSGALPAGLTLSSSGTLSGTATAGGGFSFTVTATDANANTGSQAYTLTINAATLTVSPATLAAGTDGVAYSQSLSSSGGTAPYVFALASGSLPPGLSLASNGALTGTPTGAGNYSFIVRAQDSSTGTGPYTGVQSYTVTIAAPVVTVAPSGSTLNGSYAQAYVQTFTASGGVGPYTYVESGALPAGMSWNAATGTLSGTPTQTGSFPITITATDRSTGAGAPFSASQNYTLSIAVPTITVTPGSVPGGTVGTFYSQGLTAGGGVAPYTFAVTSGALPAGLTLSSAGAISGAPTAAGTFNISVRATDANGATGTQSYSVTVGIAVVALNPASLPTATAEAAYSQTVNASGGTAPYTYAVSGGTLPAGLSFNASTGVLSGTPTAAGTFNVTIRATDSSTGTGAPFTAVRNYTLTVNAPSITVSPATLTGAQVGAAFSQQFTASGGNGSYVFNVSGGSLPAGLSLASNGALTGTPTAAGSYAFTITAKDGANFTGSQAYALTVGQAVPVAVNDAATTPSNAPVTIAVTANDTGPITSVAITQAPTHGTASVNGLSVIYTPTANFFGNDTLMYVATGPGGTSAPASVSITVTALAVPVAAPQTATILAGKPVTIHATNGATGGPFTAVTITSPPSTGTATVAGMDIVYTPPANASGPVSFGYSVANAFGPSAPANATVTVNPLPLPSTSLAVQAVAGTTVHVDLTGGATGGPFTAANVLSITPAQAGSASIRNTGNGYVLDLTVAANFSGAAQLAFTLSNAYATSAPAILSIQVTPRSDPSRNAEVLGILDAQADATRRLAAGQINNFQRRLESLHVGNATGGFTNGISLVSGGGRVSRDPVTGLMHNDNGEDDWGRRYLVQPDGSAPAQTGGTAGGGGLPGSISIWTGGAANFGTRELGGSANGIDFTTAGLSIGADKQISDSWAVGGGLGYGHDASDIGHNGSRSTVDSYNVAAYASYRPAESTFIDALVGYQWLSFDARRYVTDNGGTVQGSRDGGQVFGSFSVGYERRRDTWVLAPYGRLDIGHATLDAYTEHGDGIYALSYQRQTVDSSTGSLGLRGDFMIKRDYGVWTPRFRIEYQRDFEGASQATMRYADLLTGPLYQATLNQQARNHMLFGVGVELQTLRGLMLRMEYQNLLDNSSHDNQSILLGVEQKFQP
ncbi:putative Ig domain-containing protein [Dyella silvae]|uniref:putative Ig domain-containing protein n=1 Tax=Dyella silvae TaxID=2994424 RepID=UPI00226400E5|nr:putative Ig domain-containing protein [Dyella silvae]